MKNESSGALTMLQSSRSYWLTRFMILRLLGVVYAVAFLVAINQLIPLIGSRGLLPLPRFLADVSSSLGSNWKGFLRLPSLFWFWHSDTALLAVSWTGFILSCLVVAGYANAILMFLLWFLYMSIVHVGQDWYGYGWEIQLTETGFLAIFLCPLLDLRPFPKHAPPYIVIILFRWLIVRIMLGSGLIKVRGDEMWKNGTALNYFFETMPIPGPLTRWFHFLPKVVLKAGVWFNWLAEIVAPLFAFWPQWARHLAGIVMVLLQLFIIFSGNLSFLNWLTIVPALACFDDSFWYRILPGFLVRRAKAAAETSRTSRPMIVTASVAAALIALLSIRPVMNMLSLGQIMNTSFDPLDLVNTYGAFGSVGEQRYNVVFEGTTDSNPTDSADWKPYLYKGLPVLPNQCPPQVAPYQLRLDWQMWFAAMSSPQDYPWTIHLVWKLLENDPLATGLFAKNPFAEEKPKYVRAVLYQYRFASPGNKNKAYWTRENLGNWLPPISHEDKELGDFIRNNWGEP